MFIRIQPTTLIQESFLLSTTDQENTCTADLQAWTVLVILTFPKNLCQPLWAGGVLAAFVALLEEEHPRLVRPEVVMWPKEANRKLADLVNLFLDIERYISRMANLSWPPSKNSNTKTI